MRDPRRFLVLAFALSACSLPPEPPPPALEMPPLDASNQDLTTWWQRFGDAKLEALIARVLQQNPDLTVAAARVEEAIALQRIAGDLLPDANVNVGAGRSQTSDVNAFPRFPGIDRRNYAHSISFDVTWEVDLWGRVRSAGRAAENDLRANREALHGLQSALAAQTAQTYIRLVAIDAKVRITETTIGNRRDAVRVQTQRRDAGNGSALAVKQAEADLEAVEAYIPRLRQAQAATARALALLAGDSPKAVAQGSIDRAAALPESPAVPEGLPSDLLTQRPDIREAEARLAAAAARVEEARARYFPTIRLTAYGGQESKDLGDLLTSPATAWNLAGGLTQPLFGLKKIDAAFDAAEARGRAAEAMYAKTVQTAFAEIHDALGARSSSSTVLQAEQRRIAALRAAEKIADARYTAGNGGFFDLLDARRNLLSAQILSVDAAAEHLVATIDVYRALGGGWSPEPAPAEGVAATASATR